MQAFLTKLNERPLFIQLVFIILLIVFFMSIVSMIYVALTAIIFDMPLGEVQSALSSMDFKIRNLWFTKMVQLLYTVFSFLIPAAVFVWLTQQNAGTYLKLDRSSPNILYPLSVLLIFFSYPILNVVMEWNQALDLPSYMKTGEEDAAVLTKAFMDMQNPIDLLVNLIMIAALPAIAEELLFRGVFQNVMIKKGLSIHLAIWASAALFSAIHMQFGGFFPRMLIGGLLGYMYVWSGNLWVPIFAHFVNNAMQVLLIFFIGFGSVEQAEQQEMPWTVVAGFSFALFMTMRFFYRKSEVSS